MEGAARRRPAPAPPPASYAGLTNALMRTALAATSTSVRATALGVGDADPLLDRVRALAARPEQHGRDARGGDERGVGPVAARRRAARRPRPRAPAATISASGSTANGSRTSSVARRARPTPVDQRRDLGLDVRRRLARQRPPLERRARSAPGSSTAPPRPRSARRAPSRARAADAARAPSAASSAPSRGEHRPGGDDRVDAQVGREPCAARPCTVISAHTKPLWATTTSPLGRLGHDRGVRAQPPRSTSCTPEAGVLLVGHRGDDHVAGSPSAAASRHASSAAASPAFMS